jgi:peptide/nickel transport system ATP-binding protein
VSAQPQVPPLEAASRTVLDVTDLRVALSSGAPVVDGVSLQVGKGEILGIVGESGSGKTTTALALLGFTRPGAQIVGGEVTVAGERVPLDGTDARRVRGRLVSYVPQDPLNALNPSLRIQAAVQDMIDAHAGTREVSSVEQALAAVHLPTDRSFLRRFPHQLSGGQQQRVCIAMALVCSPPLVVLDEPTTGLDVVTQARVLEEIDRLRRENETAMIYVSHDLAVVAEVADQIAVMYAGKVVEHGATEQILGRPRHPYTRGLIASIPDHVKPRTLRGIGGVAVGVEDRPAGCAFAPRCAQATERCVAEAPPIEEVDPGRAVRCFHWKKTDVLVLEPAAPPVRESGATPLLAVSDLRAEHPGRPPMVAAQDIDFEIAPGACLALVGESGSGKTTIARCIAGLHQPAAGTIALSGKELAPTARRRGKDDRRWIQIVFQNPYDSLNPRHRVADAISWSARRLRGLDRSECDAEVARLLDLVRLPGRVAGRFPGELSGGERQRVAIARALAAGPQLLICDEVTSALDVSVQAAVLELLGDLQTELDLSLLFITHDLGVVATIADQVIVLEHGRIRERGAVGAVLAAPENEYTRQLIDAAPRLPERDLQLDQPAH